MKKMKTFSVSIPADLVDTIDKIAAKLNISRSAFITAIMKWITDIMKERLL